LEVLGDRHSLDAPVSDFRRHGPEVVVDMIAFSEADALGVVGTFRGMARRTVVISSADVDRAYARFLGTEPGPVEPPPLSEEDVLGTYLLILLGCSAVHASVLTGAQSGLWQVAIVWGVAIMLAIYTVGP
jgi:hypothetical protein